MRPVWMPRVDRIAVSIARNIITHPFLPRLGSIVTGLAHRLDLTMPK